MLYAVRIEQTEESENDYMETVYALARSMKNVDLQAGLGESGLCFVVSGKREKVMRFCEAEGQLKPRP